MDKGGQSDAARSMQLRKGASSLRHEAGGVLGAAACHNPPHTEEANTEDIMESAGLRDIPPVHAFSVETIEKDTTHLTL